MKVKARAFLFVYLVIVSLMFVGVAVAQESQPGLPDWTNFGEVVAWLAIGGGAPILVGMLVSFVAENWAGWEALPKWAKFTIPAVLAVLLGIGANFLLQQGGIIEAISPYWALIMSILLAWFGTQVGYMQTKRAGYGARFSESKLKKGG